jgi:hypothetical protein
LLEHLQLLDTLVDDIWFSSRSKNHVISFSTGHNMAYLRQVLQYFGVGIVTIFKTIIGLRQFSHIINWSL